MLITHQYEDKGIVSVYLSSNIILSKYLPESNQLTVVVKSGHQYVYDDIDLLTYIDFVRSDSQGSYLNAKIINNFKCTKSSELIDVKPIMESIQKHKNSVIK